MSGQITARLREKILSGAYGPGAQLLQDSIAAEYGVSKIPVREALVHLRSEGLVDIFAHRGFQVRPVSVAEMEEVFRLRLAIEPIAVAEGARLAEPGDIIAAKKALEVLNNTLSAGDLSDSQDLNYAFHLALTVPRLRPVTGEIVRRLHTLSQRYVRMHLASTRRIKRANKEHSDLHKAWAAGRSEDAMRLTQQHIAAIRDELTASLK